MKNCRNCEWYEQGFHTQFQSLCLNPKLLRNNSGGTTLTIFERDTGECGREAKLFEPKNIESKKWYEFWK